jgi:hypothetical protein
MSFGLLSSFSGNIPISGNLSVTVLQNVDITGAYLTATGGAITYYGNQKIHTFFGSGAFQVLSVGSDPNDGSQVRYMVIGGGGGGGRDMGGGGGAGGYQAATGFPVSVGTYTITVGAGGGGANNVPVGSTGASGSMVAGANGSPSIFSSVTCPGGGGGASKHNDIQNYAGSGGSGGGASGLNNNRGVAFGSQGYPGGQTGGPYWPGGGGGAGGRGYNGAESNTSTRAPGDGSNTNGGSHGGIGVSNDILGAIYWWAGGGGGGGHSNYAGNGGSGGGGGGSPAHFNNNFGRAGGLSFTLASPGMEGWPNSADSNASQFNNAGNGAQFSGGGGGGTAHAHGVTAGNGGPGGSGIVVIRYRYKV